MSTPSTEAATLPVSTAKKWSFGRVVTVATAGIVGLVAVLFVIALVFAISNAEGAASFFRYLRDVFLVVLSVQCVLIVVSFAIFLIQVARFFALLKSEVQPIAKEAKETVQTVRQSAAFIGKQGAEPLIKSKSFFAGFGAFVKELLAWRKLFKK